MRLKKRMPENDVDLITSYDKWDYGAHVLYTYSLCQAATRTIVWLFLQVLTNNYARLTGRATFLMKSEFEVLVVMLSNNFLISTYCTSPVLHAPFMAVQFRLLNGDTDYWTRLILQLHLS